MLKNAYLFACIFAVGSLLFLASCGDDEEAKPGAAPVAVAVGPQSALVNSAIQLDGTNSTDPDGDQLTYSWTVTASPQGSSASVNNSNQAVATFTPDQPGSYTITLTVSDGIWEPVTDEVFLTVVEMIGNPPLPVIRDDDNRVISEDNQNNEITVGVPFILDGSNSSDPDNDEITFSWEVIENPEGSNPVINNETSEEATFVADVTGEYIIQLTVEDENGNIATTDVTVQATANPIVWDESIAVNTTFENVFEDPALPDYVLTTSVQITAELTIMPGVMIEVEPGNKITVSTISGAFIATGKADSMIVMTAQDQTNGWPGILFLSNNQKNQMDHVQISYGGAAALGSGVPEAAIGVESGDFLSITNSVIDNSAGYGLYIEGGGELGDFENNDFNNNALNPMALAADQVGQLDNASTYTDNGDNSVEVLATTLNLNDEISWPVLSNGVSYFITGDLAIQSGVSIAAGARLEVDNTARFVVSGDGYLNAIGTASDSIVITARDKVNGWEGIAVFNNLAGNQLDYVSISYGGNTGLGSGLEPANIGIENGDRMTITNSIIAHSFGNYGIFVESGGNIGSAVGNHFYKNALYPIGLYANQVHQLKETNTFEENGSQHIEIRGGTVNESQEVTWVKFGDGTPYYVSDGINLQSGVKVMPGATLKFIANEDIRTTSDGYLNAVGTADEMITFTAMNQNDKWNGIAFYTGFNSNQLDYCVISYAGANGMGSGLDPTNIGIEAGDKATIQNCEITNSAMHGIFVESGGSINDGATVEQMLNDFGNTFSENAGTDVIIE